MNPSNELFFCSILKFCYLQLGLLPAIGVEIDTIVREFLLVFQHILAVIFL